MYFKFGYTNLYYHFYVFAVSALLFLFLGFNSMIVWYARTYPLGKMGIPVAVQRFRSKILSVVLPVILLASSILLMAFYFIQVNTVTEAIDKRIFDSFYFLNYISNESETSGTLIEGPLEEFSGIWIRLNPDRIIEYSNADYLKGKIADNIIELGNQPDYLYNAVLSLLDNNNLSRGKTVGVFNGEKSVFFVNKNINSNSRDILIFNESQLYRRIYSSTFYAILAIIIVNIIIRYFINKRLIGLSRSIDTAMPVLQEYIKGNLTEEIRLIKSRDVMEDFVRSFIGFKDVIAEFISQSKKMTDTASSFSGSISESGSAINSSSHRQARLLEESSVLVKGIADAFNKTAADSFDENKNIQELEERISNLNKSMNMLNQDAREVNSSFDFVQNSAYEGARLVKLSSDGFKGVAEHYENILNVIRLISDIAEQVNLLSLNASIEAARAGDQGKGFAVVAEEISKLADRTSQSVKDITSLINEGNEEIKVNINNIDKMKAAFDLILQNIENSAKIINGFINTITARVDDFAVINQNITGISRFSEELSRSTNEQSKNTAKVTETIEIVGKEAELFVEQAAELSKSADELKSMTNTMNNALESFKV
jgi:methyl-accepting chemotaxis protein